MTRMPGQALCHCQKMVAVSTPYRLCVVVPNIPKRVVLVNAGRNGQQGCDTGLVACSTDGRDMLSVGHNKLLASHELTDFWLQNC